MTDPADVGSPGRDHGSRHIVSRRVITLGVPSLGLAACTADSVPGPTPSTAVRTSSPSPPPTSDSIDWVVLENQREGTAWRRPAASMATDDQLCGYPSRVVMDAGDSLDLCVRSAVGPWSARILRLGDYGGAGAREVHVVEGVGATTQPEPSIDEDRCVRAGWSPGPSVDTDGWPPGAYLVILEAAGLWRYTCFVIRSVDAADRVALVLATSTWAAYNTWGGYSLYKGPTNADPRAFRVSHSRPQDGNGAPKLMSFEAATIQLAESMGVPVAYLSSNDLESSQRLTGARGIVSLGHDEYWSVQMRDTVEAARDAGTNLAFLGANACYWRVRLSADGQEVMCYKVDDDPVLGRESTTLWRQGSQPQPENSLTGMLYEAFPAKGDLTVHDASSFLLEGTRAGKGSRFPGVVGTEVDRAYPIAGTPTSLNVICHSEVVAGHEGAATFADFTYYRAASGAGVIATGSMQWTWTLLGTNRRLGITRESVDFVRTVTRNILTAMSVPRVGDRFPPTPNLHLLAASASTDTGTGGRVGGASS